MRGQSRTIGRDPEIGASSDVSAVLLAQRAQGGDEEAWASLWMRYKRPLMAFIARRLQGRVSKEDVEDLAQDVFTKAIRSIRTFRFQSHISTWLFSIAKNECNDWYAEQCKLQVSEGELDPESPAGAVTSHEKRTICFVMAEKIWTKMNPQWQRVIKRVVWNAESKADIAADEGISENRVGYIVRVFTEKLLKSAAAD